jgi:hypothetical protein
VSLINKTLKLLLSHYQFITVHLFRLDKFANRGLKGATLRDRQQSEDTKNLCGVNKMTDSIKEYQKNIITNLTAVKTSNIT